MNQFSIGGVLSRSFSTWISNFLSFFAVSLVVYIPAMLFDYMLETGSLVMSPPVARFITGILTVILSMIATSAITFGVFEQLRGRHVSVGQCLSTGMARVPSVLGLGFLLALIFGGLGIALVLGGSIVGAVVGMISPVLGMIVVAVLVIGPLAAMYCRFYVAVPAAVVETAGSIESLRRSALLTDGYRKSIFGVVVLVFLLSFGAGFLWGLILAGHPMVLLVMTWIFNIALGALGSTAMAVVYHDLRMVKEGVGTEELARVFD